MKKAFYYMFSDDKFLLKYFTVFIFMYIPFLIFNCVATKLFIHNILHYFFARDIMVIIYIFVFICLAGYWINCIKTIMDPIKHTIVPYINLKNDFIIGIKCIIAYLIFALLLISSCLFIALLASVPFMKYFFKIVAVLLIIASYILQISFIWIFAKTNNIYSYTKILDAIEYINCNKKSYFFAVFLLMLIQLLLNIITKAVVHHFVSITIFFALIPYLIYLTAYISAKALKVESAAN